GTADELAFDIELGDRRPVAIFLDSGADLRVLEHVDGLVFGSKAVEDRDRAARKAALREQGRALHEQHDFVALHELVDPGSGVTHWSSPCSALRFRAAV